MNAIPRPVEVRRRGGAAARALEGLDRAARTPRLLDGPEDGAAHLRGARLKVIGLGSVGSGIADLCSRWSPAELLLVDRGRFKAESLLTHSLLHPRDIGRSKALVAGERAKAVSPETRVSVYEGAIEDLPLDTFIGADAVLLASDNLACELEVAQRCTRLGLRLIQASCHGPSLVAQVRSLANVPGADGACLCCDYRAADWEALDRGTLYSCAGGDGSRSAQPTQVPTMSTAELCTAAACMAVMELAGLLQGLHAPQASRMIESCGFTNASSVTPLTRRDGCPQEHAAWQVVPWDEPLAQTTPRRFFAAAGCDAQIEPQALALCVEGEVFGRLLACACDRHAALGRFLTPGIDLGVCADCGQARVAHPLHTFETVPVHALREHLDRTLGELGAQVRGGVRVQRGEQSFFFHRAPGPEARA